MKIIIIIPTYNESKVIENTISVLIHDIVNTSLEDDFYVMVSDARSPDGTYELVKNKYSDNDRVIPVLESGEKLGIGHAYKEAMKLAFNQYNADAVMTFDADLSHDHKIIPTMVKQMKSGSDAVIGTRYRKGGGIPEDWAFHRKLLSVMGNLFINTLFIELKQTDFTSGFRLINKKVLDLLISDATYLNGYTFSIYANIVPAINGLKVSEVAYKFTDREAGESKMPASYMKDALVFIMKQRIDVLLNKYKFVKALIAGGIGSVMQIITYFLLFRPLIEGNNVFNIKETLTAKDLTILGTTGDIYPRYVLAIFFAIEVGILITFIINNSWTFAREEFKSGSFIKSYLQVQLVAIIPITIQLTIITVASYLLGRGLIRDGLYQILGILIGFMVSFYLYKKIIWKTQ